MWYEGNIDIHCGRHPVPCCWRWMVTMPRSTLRSAFQGRKTRRKATWYSNISPSRSTSELTVPWVKKSAHGLTLFPDSATLSLQDLRHHKQSNTDADSILQPQEKTHNVSYIKYQPSPSQNHLPFFCHLALPSFPPGEGGGGQACWLLLHHRCNQTPPEGAELQRLTATSDARLWRAAVR